MAACGSYPVEALGVMGLLNLEVRIYCVRLGKLFWQGLGVKVSILMNMTDLIDNIHIWEMDACLLLKVEYI